jgi:hypothetical protein
MPEPAGGPLRYLFVGTILITLSSAAGFITPHQVVLLPERVFDLARLELWRTITCFLWHSLGFSFIMNTYFLYLESGELESTTYGGRPADYAWFILLCMALHNVVAMLYTDSMLLSDALMLSIVYLWAVTHMEQTVTFMFGIKFKAIYLPWVLVIMDPLMGGRLSMDKLMGIAVGHVLYFIEIVYPRSPGGWRVLPTPRFLKRLMPQAPEARPHPGDPPGSGGSGGWGNGGPGTGGGGIANNLSPCAGGACPSMARARAMGGRRLGQ